MNKLYFIFVLLLTCSQVSAQDTLPAQLAQHQLDAYNQRDLEDFLVAFSDTVKVYNFPDELILQGKEKMRKNFKRLFSETPDLHCTLMNRMVFGKTVIDQEYVTLGENVPPVEAMAIYHIAGNKIAEIYFVRKEEEMPDKMEVIKEE